MTFRGRGVRVERNECVGGQPCCWYGHMEATGEVCSNMGVGLQMGRKRGQGRLCMSTTAAADLKVRHHGHLGASTTAKTKANCRSINDCRLCAGTMLVVDIAGGRVSQTPVPSDPKQWISVRMPWWFDHTKLYRMNDGSVNFPNVRCRWSDLPSDG